MPGLGSSPLVVTLAEDEATGESLHATSRFYAQRFFAQYKGRLAAAGQMGEHFFVEPAPANRYRVVFVGASTVQGFPHPRRLAASSFLQVMLSDAWPEREVEVVNLGITSIASFAVAQVVEDALVLSPDLVVVYTGHNEFYGLYGSGRNQRLQYFLRQLHLTHLVDGLLGGIGSRDEPTDLIKMAAARGEVPLRDPGRAMAEQNLRDNLRRVSRLCERAQVPLVLCTIVANDAGFAPVGLTEGDEVWKSRVEQAAQVLTRGYVAPEDAEDALQQLEQAAALSSEHAWLWYLQGRALERLGRDAEARRAFRKARDLDTMPWRAPTAHNAVIRAVAKEHGAVLADVEAAFADAAPAQGVGWEWMVDHVHFSVAGQALLARTVLHSIAAWEDIDLRLLRSAEAYRRDLGDLPVERVVAYNKMGAMLAQAPLHQYNEHNARYLKQLAAMEGQRLSLGERRGVEQWTQKQQGPLVLAVADQLFTERDFVRAQVYYAAARREVPFTAAWVVGSGAVGVVHQDAGDGAYQRAAGRSAGRTKTGGVSRARSGCGRVLRRFCQGTALSSTRRTRSGLITFGARFFGRGFSPPLCVEFVSGVGGRTGLGWTGGGCAGICSFGGRGSWTGGAFFADRGGATEAVRKSRGA